MFKKWITMVTAIFVSGFYWLSFEREEYVREVVHSECNAVIKGFFNKSVTSTGWNCTQNGEVIHSVGFKASMIPSVFELTVFFVSVVVLGGIVFMAYNYRGDVTFEEQLQNLKDKIVGEISGD